MRMVNTASDARFSSCCRIGTMKSSMSNGGIKTTRYAPEIILAV